MANENETTTTETAPSGGLNLAGADLAEGADKRIPAIAKRITAGVKKYGTTMAELARACLELRMCFVRRSDGKPDLDGRSNEYRMEWGRILTEAGLTTQEDRDRLSDALRYHVRKLAPEVVPAMAEDRTETVTKTEEDGTETTETVTIPADQVAHDLLRSRGFLPEDQRTEDEIAEDEAKAAKAAAKAAASGGTTSEVIGSAETDKAAQAAAASVAQKMGERGDDIEAARQHASGIITGTLANLTLADQLDVLHAILKSVQVSVEAAPDKVTAPKRVRALLLQISLACDVAAGVIEKTETSTEAAETAAA